MEMIMSSKEYGACLAITATELQKQMVLHFNFIKPTLPIYKCMNLCMYCIAVIFTQHNISWLTSLRNLNKKGSRGKTLLQ